jgi:subfamily B ATP-binding cassette protein MsbA
VTERAPIAPLGTSLDAARHTAATTAAQFDVGTDLADTVVPASDDPGSRPPPDSGNPAGATSPAGQGPKQAETSKSRRLVSPKPLARLLPLVRPYAGRLVFAGFCLVAAAAAGLAFPWVVRYLLDAAFQQHNRRLLNQIFLGLVALFAVQALLNFSQVYILSSTTERVIARLREDLFAHLVRLSPAFFTEQRTGELTSRLSADLAVLQSVCNTYVSEFARQVIFVVGGVFLLAYTHARLAATTLEVAPVVVAVAFLFGRALRRASAGVQDRVAEAMGTADEAFSQIRTVQGFVREAIEIRRYSDHLREVVTAAIHRSVLRALFFGVVGFIAFSSIAVILWVGGQQVLQGGLTVGGFVQFLFYAFMVAAAIRKVSARRRASSSCSPRHRQSPSHQRPRRWPAPSVAR